MDPPSEVCARTGSMLPCPAAPESRRRASPFGAAVTVRRTEIWFTWPSGAGSPFGAASSSLRGAAGPVAEATILSCRCCLRWGMVRATPPHRQVPPAGGRTPVEVAAPWPFTAALLDLGSASPRSGPRGPSTGPLTTTFVVMRATLLTLAPTIRRVPVLATRPQSRVSSLGVVQRSPLHRTDRGIRLPETATSLHRREADVARPCFAHRFLGR